MAREVRRQTLKWKKEQTDEKRRAGAEPQDGIFCKSQEMKIDRSTCTVMQMRTFNNCIGCRHCGG
ncbi:MAG: hypothetical protein Q8M92_08000 [Candidatus Subteraquimicrobiales bacterium]|nr:hypothetical protein [Candidatus Subteraquimicrobiales bacterium]